MNLRHSAVDPPLRPHFTPMQDELLNHRREMCTRRVCHFSLYRIYCISSRVSSCLSVAQAFLPVPQVILGTFANAWLYRCYYRIAPVANDTINSFDSHLSR